MQVLNFSVSNQILTAACPGRLVVSHTRGHLFAQFALDQEWDGLSVTAVFSNDFSRQSYQRILTSDPVEVPEEVLVPGRLFVSLVGLGDGGALRLTTKCMDKPIVVYRAGELVGLAPDEATPELWEQVLAAMGSLADLKTSDKSSLVAAINESLQSGGTGSVDPEEIAQAVADYMAAHPIQETDPTVPDWAKEAEKPSYTAQEVGADPSGTAASLVAAHNTAEAAHNDIRLLISGLTDRLNALADSDDTTLDQLSEVVAYIKANRELIASITTDKVSVTDIVNNLVTNVANKPLSAAQGVALKALIDAISIPDKLPNPNALTFTGAATGSYDGSKPLTVNVPSLTVDDSLTKSGQAADAAAVGEQLRSLSEEIANLPQADWNQNDDTQPDYVKNRPFYTGDQVETALVEESTASFANSGSGFYVATLPISFNAEFGQTYKVSWDGTSYECVCRNYSNIPLIGNQSIMGLGSDTGEPFLIFNESRLNETGWTSATTDTSASHTFSISILAAELVKIDEKYLPEYSVVYSDDPTNWSNPKKQQMYDDFISGKLVLYRYSDKKICIVLSVFYNETVGLKFVFFTDNILRKFENTAFSNPIELSESGINNLIKNQINNLTRWKLYDAKYSEVSVGDLVSMYVAFDSTTKKACIFTNTKAGTGTIGANSTIVTNGDSDIVLSSSTPDSAKKFKITVDDSGTISATEVTS